ncbi:MAG: hypothetical protein NTX45_05145 [Proteobacteria bacterium]|nr:hypothetical protein [Pseudomonadota bacterium]
MDWPVARCWFLLAPAWKIWIDAKGEASGEAKKCGLGGVHEDMRTVELTGQMLLDNPGVEIPLDNRRLVDGSTHPDHLASLTGERWEKHGQIMEGRTHADGVAASLVAAIYDKPFGDFSYSDLNENARTRLGLNTLRILLNTIRRASSSFSLALDRVTSG